MMPPALPSSVLVSVTLSLLLAPAALPVLPPPPPPPLIPSLITRRAFSSIHPLLWRRRCPVRVVRLSVLNSFASAEFFPYRFKCTVILHLLCWRRNNTDPGTMGKKKEKIPANYKISHQLVVAFTPLCMQSENSVQLQRNNRKNKRIIEVLFIYRK